MGALDEQKVHMHDKSKAKDSQSSSNKTFFLIYANLEMSKINYIKTVQQPCNTGWRYLLCAMQIMNISRCLMHQTLHFNHTNLRLAIQTVLSG